MFLIVLDNILAVVIFMVVLKTDIEYSFFERMYIFDFSKDIDMSCGFEVRFINWMKLVSVKLYVIINNN